MKRRLNFGFLLKISIFPLILMFVGASCNKNENNSAFQPILKSKYRKPIIQCRKTIYSYLNTSFIPGVSVAVSLNGETIWSEGMGCASLEFNVPVNRATKFRIGNTTEMFTAYIIAKLHEQGKLNIDSSFFKYIPEFPAKQFDFTLRMLGVNTAGFDESKIERLVRIPNIRDLKDYITYFENSELVYEPESYFLPSEYSFALLGILAEEISGENYFDLVKEIITDTLNLSSTVLDNTQHIINNRSDCYTFNYVAQLVNAPFVDLSPFAPVHGLLSTADDLNLAAQQVLKPGFFNAESIGLFSNNHHLKKGVSINRSFGWWVSTDNEGQQFLAQVGSTIGGASLIIVYPNVKLVVSMVANKADEVSELPAYEIAQFFLEHIKSIAE